MKSLIQLMRITVMLPAIFLVLADFTGCKSLQDTSFAPLYCELEPIPGGGAQYIVIINTSKQTLHHIRFLGNVWYDHYPTILSSSQSLIPVSLPALTFSFNGFIGQWEPDHVERIKNDLSPISAESSMLYPVSRVQIAGKCDEGPFREDWQINGAGQLQPMGIGPHRE
jgi:hypothetical protein